jgi:hypothetical protein
MVSTTASIKCQREAHWSPGSVPKRCAHCAGLAHQYRFDCRRAVLARTGSPLCAANCQSDATSKLHTVASPSLTSPSSASMLLRYDRQKKSEGASVRCSTRTSPNNRMQRAARYIKCTRPTVSHASASAPLRRRCGARSLMRDVGRQRRFARSPDVAWCKSVPRPYALWVEDHTSSRKPRVLGTTTRPPSRITPPTSATQEARVRPLWKPEKGQRSCVENGLWIKCLVKGQWPPGSVRHSHLRPRRPSGVDALCMRLPGKLVLLRRRSARSILWPTQQDGRGGIT